MSVIARDGGRSTVVIAIGTTIVSGIPVFLIGALFTQIDSEIGIPPWSLGVIVAVFWTSAAFFSAPSGALTARIGARKVMLMTIGAAAASLLGAGVITPTWHWFILWAAMGGLATGLCHPSTNHLIRMRVAPRRLALAFGIKQSSVPLASFAAGIAIPVIALTLGWRWAYLAAALGCLLVFALFLLLGPRRLPKGTVRKVSTVPLTRPQRTYFRYLTAVTTLGAGAAACASTFGVVAAIEHGMHPGEAGLLFGGAGLAGALVRITVGALERGGGKTLRVIIFMLASGLVGSALMALPSGWTFGLGLVLVLGLGWGWAGLTHFVVSTTAGPATPAATGLVQTGSYLGCATGPIVAGAIFAQWGSAPIWYLTTAMFVLACVFAVVLVRRPVPPQPQSVS